MWLTLLHTAETHGPTIFHMATVSHKRWDPCLLYCTSLNITMKMSCVPQNSAAFIFTFSSLSVVVIVCRI